LNTIKRFGELNTVSDVNLGDILCDYPKREVVIDFGEFIGSEREIPDEGWEEKVLRWRCRPLTRGSGPNWQFFEKELIP